MIEEKYKCDLCNREITKERTKNRLQVIFETDQEEGRSCKPYLDDVQIDLCAICYDKLLQGKYLFASGAMGHNNYYFKENENNG